MLTHFSCNDCDELSDSLPETQQDCRQTVPGSFLGQWWQLELPGLSIVKHETNYGLHNSAVISDSSLLAYLPIKQGGTLVLEGHSWDGPALFFAQPKTCPVVSVPSDFACYTIEFDLTELSRAASAMGVSLPPNKGDLYWLPDPLLCSAAASLIRRAFMIGRKQELTRQQFADKFVTSWLNLLSQSNGQPQSVDRSTLSQRRQAALNAANYIRTRLSDDLSLADLCEVAGVTDRTLRNGFQDVFGMSPGKWLKLERLSAVRRDLKAADPKKDRVGNIAMKYHFFQLAHFATDYRKHFGESPSETLRR